MYFMDFISNTLLAGAMFFTLLFPTAQKLHIIKFETSQNFRRWQTIENLTPNN